MAGIPDAVGKYKILERLGRGGMSVVYKAKHPTLGTPVVLKKLTLRGDTAYRERFRREATLMMKLRHANVVGVYDHFKEANSHYLVMEYVDGRPLSELLAREGSFPPDEAAWLVGQIAAALSHIHSQGIVHRDVKPSNVLLGRDGSVKLGDFGIAFTPSGGEDITAQGTALGTPSFMAPEQLEDARTADFRADMWSLGVCLFELLTGRKFVTGPTPAAIREALSGAVRGMRGRLPSKLPFRLKRFLIHSLRLRPESRLKDGSAAVRMLGAFGAAPLPPKNLEARMNALFSANSMSESTPESKITPFKPDSNRATPQSSRSLLSALFRRNTSPSSGIPDDEKVRSARIFQFGIRRDAKQSARRKAVKSTETANLQKSPKFSRSVSTSKLESTPKSHRSVRLSTIPRWTVLLILPIAAAALVLLLLPGAWDVLLRSDSYGMLKLELLYAKETPEYWISGVEAQLYREEAGILKAVLNPVMRSVRNDNGGNTDDNFRVGPDADTSLGIDGDISDGDGSDDKKVLASRRLSLPAGAYRIRWNLGDKVSWRSFYLSSIRKQRHSGVKQLLLHEELGQPPVFPLDFSWSAVDAASGLDISSEALIGIERIDLPGGPIESGGNYRFHLSASGYRPAVFSVPVSPWRRELHIAASLWPKAAYLTIENTRDRSISPRLNGSRRYMDISSEPTIRRIRRLDSGETATLALLPGNYTVKTGFLKVDTLELKIGPGETIRSTIDAAGLGIKIQ